MIQVAELCGVSRRIAPAWIRRYREHGLKAPHSPSIKDRIYIFVSIGTASHGLWVAGYKSLRPVRC